MSKNLDRIATVDIDLTTPIVSDVSFDNMLIFGPLPKVAPEVAPPKVGAYSSLDEVLDAGWIASGEGADPIGEAAQVAFSQSPKPNLVYIAPMQLTPDAVAAGVMIETVKPIIEAFMFEDSSTEYTTKYDSAKRVLLVDLKKTAEEIQTYPQTDPIKAVVDAGYTVKIGEDTIQDLAGFKSNQKYEDITSNLTEASDSKTVQFIVTVVGEDNVEVDYGIIVRFPKEAFVIPDFTGGEITNPQDEIESPVDTLRRAMSTSGWYVACSAGIDSTEYEEIAKYIEAQEKMFGYTELNFFDTPDDPKASVGNVYLRTFGVYGKEASTQVEADMPRANLYANVAFTARWLNYTAGSETAAHKSITSVYPSDGLSTTEMNALEKGCLSYIVTVGNKVLTMNGMVMNGEWCDTIRFRDWLKNDIQVRVVNVFVERPKVPYTDPGIALIQSAVVASLKAGQDAGGIAPTEYDEDGNAIVGYTTTVPKASAISSSQKASRKLTGVTFKARLAGAIHFAEIKGSLTYAL